jgi:AcrR family transcriptional regulator
MNRPVTDRKKSIVEAASELFSKQGFEGVTIKQLAGACSITEAALYRHYDSKDAIYDAVLDSIGDRLHYQDLFTDLESERDLEALMRSLARHIIDFFSSNADLYRLLLFSALKGHAKAKRVYDTIRGTYTKFLKLQLDRLHKEGRIIEKNNEMTARCFVGMVFDCSLASTLWKGFQGQVFNPDDVVANNVPIYVRGLRTEA